MSHELRTPLNGIIGFSEMLIDERPGSINDRQREYLTDILRERPSPAPSHQRHTRSLQGGSRAHGVAPESFSLDEAVSEVIAVIGTIASEKRIDCRMSVVPGPARVILDRPKFIQVLYNLLSNAVKFTPEDGVVSLDVSTADRDCVRLDVRTTGSESGARIFRTCSRNFSNWRRILEALPGTDLGWHLTRKIVRPSRNHRGHQRTRQGQQVLSDLAMHRGAVVTTLVLIVDDNPINLRLAADVLEHEGFEVQRAMDAEEAQSLLGAKVPDLILMDIALPGMDGLTLTGILKSDERYAGVPIVALTASAMSGDEARSRSAGCDGYISKPIDTRRFTAQVRQYLRTKPAEPSGSEDKGEV